MLIDEADIVLSGGTGGAGRVSFGNKKKSGPDGGNGGAGGDLYIRVSPELTLLSQFSSKTVFQAGNGIHGDKNKKTGSDGEDFEILLPIGTVIKNLDSGGELELIQNGERILFCKGGKGGKGNWEFRSSTNTTPRFAQPGFPGEEKKLHLDLKLIAQYGLIGLPNAGKSSLLNELTKANAKVASYSFTTLEPNLGALPNRKIIADIPGLIEGASDGKGLGIRFLKHIERVTLLLHCIALDSADIVKDYQTVRTEMEKYNSELLEKEEIILLTKSDLVTEKELKVAIKKLTKFKRKILPVSIIDNESLSEVKKYLDS